MNPLTDWISFDVETVGEEDGYALQPWRAKYSQAKIRTYAYSWIEDGKIRHASDAAEINSFFRAHLSRRLQQWASEGKYLITWKGTFDIAWLIAYGLIEEVYACKWIDGMVMWKNLDRNRKAYGLKSAVREFLPSMANYEQDVDFEGDLATLLEYNEKDTDATLLIALKLWSQLTVKERTALLIDFCDMPDIANRNVEGIHINIDGVKKTAVKLNKQRSESYQKLLPHVQTMAEFFIEGGKRTPAQLRKRFPSFDKLDPDRFKKIADESAVNFDSDAEVRQLLFEDWGLTPLKMTKGGTDGMNKKTSTDKESLIEISHDDERAKWVQQYRETTGLISKCVKSVVEALKYNNPSPGCIYPPIVRPEMNKSGTVTDRCTYSSYIDTGGKK